LISGASGALAITHDSKLTETAVIFKILEHLGLPIVAPTPAAARPPPQLELSFEVC